jgi:hypothetical protein
MELMKWVHPFKINGKCEKIHQRLLIDTDPLLASSYSLTFKIPIDLLIWKTVLFSVWMGPFKMGFPAKKM